jgi:ribosome-binding factor A
MDREEKRRGKRRARTEPAFEAGEAAGHRHTRLEKLMFEELGATLRDEVRDPALAEVRVLRTELSADYAHVRVYVTGDATTRAATLRACERASGFLRARLVDALDLKRVPQLGFVWQEIADDGANEEGSS